MCLLVDGLSAAGRIHCAVINALIAQGREGVVRLSQPRHRVFQTLRLTRAALASATRPISPLQCRAAAAR